MTGTLAFEAKQVEDVSQTSIVPPLPANDVVENTVLRATLPDPELKAKTDKQGRFIRQWKGTSKIWPDDRAQQRLQNQNCQRREDGKVFCYQTVEGNWVPELRKRKTVAVHRAEVAGVVDAVLNSKDHPGRFVRERDSEAVFTGLGYKNDGHFPPKSTPGLRVVPLIHADLNDQHGKFPHPRGNPLAGRKEVPSEGHLRLVKVSDSPQVFVPTPTDENPNEVTEVGYAPNVLVPTPPNSKFTPGNVNTVQFPFVDIPTNAMTIARSTRKGKENVWVAQTLPEGKLTFTPYSTIFHYSSGAITGSIIYKEKNTGKIVMLDKEGHIQRFLDNAKTLGYDGLTREFVEELIENQLKADEEFIPQQGNPAGNRYYLRLVILRDNIGPALTGPAPEKQGFMIMAMGDPVGDYKVPKNKKLKVGMPGARPVPSRRAQTKSTITYDTAVEALGDFKRKTGRSDLHEAIFVREDGTPQEGTSSSLFFLDESQDPPVFISPDPARADVLPGRTVAILSEIAKELGWDVKGYEYGKKQANDGLSKDARKNLIKGGFVEPDYDVDDLDMEIMMARAQEGKVSIGMAGTAMGMREVGEIVDQNGTSIKIGGEGYSPNMQRLQNIYEAIVTGNCESLGDDSNIAQRMAAKFMQNITVS